MMPVKSVAVNAWQPSG